MKTINLATISIGALTILLLAIASLLIHPLVVLGAFTLIALLCGLVWLARHRAPSFRKAVAYANLGLAGVCLLVWLMNMLGWIGVGNTAGQAIAAFTCLALGLMLLDDKNPPTA